MFISASRRTDIPAHYSDWFFDKLIQGFVHTRNPMNHKQVREIILSPHVVDGIVFWTKNPIPMLDKLDLLSEYMYYFQFTLTPYGRDIEPNLPEKDDLLAAFKKLSAQIGADRVIWRYDPILLNEKYSVDEHLRAFEKMARFLRGSAKKVIISFIDTDYRGVKRNAAELALTSITEEVMMFLGTRLACIAHANGMTIESCAMPHDFGELGIEHARCIDDRLFSALLGREIKVPKDRNQRPGCGCAASADIGAYNTCATGCRYCYANYNEGAVVNNRRKHSPQSPLL